MTRPLTTRPPALIAGAASNAALSLLLSLSPPPFTPSQPADQGLIPGRATLVVCPVSLVGQWVSEAHNRLAAGSRLSVYQYHGGSRSGNMSLISSHDIVVTTYGIAQRALAAKERGPSLADVKWWRIVLDESHTIKGKRTDTLSHLASDRRWCVTGTPICTNSGDLMGQMAFAGVSQIELPLFTPL